MELIGFIYSYGIILQALAIVHFVQRRPETFWLWIILVGGGLGALVYIAVEVLPDIGLLRGSFEGVSRRRRARNLEAVVIDNPSVGNQEELADLYLEEKQFARRAELYDKVIARSPDSFDAFYRRGLAAAAMDDYAAAIPDLERVVAKDPKYDFYRAMALLAHAHGRAGDAGRADALFKSATEISTLSETYCHYAAFLAAPKRVSERRATGRSAFSPNGPRCRAICGGEKTRSAALALAPDILVNSVCPGPVGTRMYEEFDARLDELTRHPRHASRSNRRPARWGAPGRPPRSAPPSCSCCPTTRPRSSPARTSTSVAAWSCSDRATPPDAQTCPDTSHMVFRMARPVHGRLRGRDVTIEGNETADTGLLDITLEGLPRQDLPEWLHAMG